MKHVRESLREFEEHKFFRLFEEEKTNEKESLQSKEKDGLAIVDKIKKNFDDFKKDASDEILRYKEFWEENQSTKKSFSEAGSIYKLFDSDYVVGVLELPVETRSDGTVEGGLGASDEPEEEIIEGKEITQDEPDPSDPQPVTEAEEGEDLGLDLGLPPAENKAPEQESEIGDLADETPVQEPEVPVEEPQAPVEEPISSEPQTAEEPAPDLTTPQKYFVLYNMSGGEREEIFRCGSNNVVKAFDEFYNDIFKGSMKEIIAQYKKQKEEEKVEAEKAEKAKVEKDKESKVQKFLGESLEEDDEDLTLDDADIDDWLDKVAEYLRYDFEVEEEDIETFMDIAMSELEGLYEEGTSAFDASSIVAANEDVWEELERLKEEDE